MSKTPEAVIEGLAKGTSRTLSIILTFGGVFAGAVVALYAVMTSPLLAFLALFLWITNVLLEISLRMDDPTDGPCGGRPATA